MVEVGDGSSMLNTTPWSSLGASSRWAKMKNGTRSSVSNTDTPSEDHHHRHPAKAGADDPRS
jgi:hypothetical protein